MTDAAIANTSVEEPPRLSAGSGARWLAWALWAIATAQVVFAFALAALNRLNLERLLAEYVVSQTAATAAFATVGLVIATRRPGHPVGWLFCAAGVLFGVSCWVGQYARYTLVTRPGALPGGELVAGVFTVLMMPLLALVVIFLPLLFPDGRLPSARWRPGAWMALSAVALLMVTLALTPGPLDASLPEVANPFAPAGAERVAQAITPLTLLLMAASLIAAVSAPVARYRRSRGVERQQIKWFAYAAALLVAALVTPVLLGHADPVTGSTLLSGVLLSLAFPFLPAAAGIAVLRYRLYEIDGLINRTLVYGALTASVVALYIFVVGYLSAIFHARGSLLVSLVATGVVAVGFAPLRDWLQQGVNRLMYGERDEPYTVLARLGRRLEATLAPDAVLTTIAETIREALKLPYAAVMLPREAGWVVVAASGEPGAPPVELPLSYQGETVGRLLIGPRAPGETLTGGDLRLLDDLAHHAGVAVHGVGVMAELQRARERLVLAREEERRRLRRDLHDDLAPSLAALALSAGAIGELIPANPAAATAAARKLESAIRAAIGDVRRLVYDLRPPTLDELGLVEAIREQAARYNEWQEAAGAEGRLRVVVEAPEQLPALPAAVEVAAYRIVQEALMNVARHAHARACVVRLAATGYGMLEIEVRDDGVGLPAERRNGVGLPSMRERAAELGGVCEIERVAPTGTRVTARLPVLREGGR